VAQEGPGNHHEEQGQEGFTGVLDEAHLHEYRQRHQKRCDQGGWRDEMKLLVGVAHDQHTDRGAERDRYREVMNS
jgi:hypothetical protein